MVEVKDIIALDDVKKEILEFCLEPQSRTDILDHIQIASTPIHYTKYIGQLLTQRFIKTDVLDNRRSPREKFVITQKGLNYLKAIA